MLNSNFLFLNLPTATKYMSREVQNLELVAFVEPLVPLKDPVKNGVEWSENKAVFECDGRALHQCVNQSYHLHNIRHNTAGHFIRV